MHPLPTHTDSDIKKPQKPYNLSCGPRHSNHAGTVLQNSVGLHRLLGEIRSRETIIGTYVNPLILFYKWEDSLAINPYLLPWIPIHDTLHFLPLNISIVHTYMLASCSIYVCTCTMVFVIILAEIWMLNPNFCMGGLECTNIWLD